MMILARSQCLMDPGKLAQFDSDFCRVPSLVRKAPWNHGLRSFESQMQFLHFPLRFPREFYVVYDSDENPVGRIGCARSLTSDTTGTTGFFECNSPQTASTLMIAADIWHKSMKHRRVLGPMDYSTWFNYRMIDTSGNDEFFSWEPLSPPEYKAAFLAAGFEEYKRYHSTCLVTDGLDQLKKAYDLALSNQILIRPFDMANFDAHELPAIYQITMEAFRKQFQFEPIPFEIFKTIYSAALRTYDFSYSRVAQTNAGQPIGFIFAFLDKSTKGTEYLVIKSIALLPEFRNMHLSTAMLYDSGKAAYESKGITNFISALVIEGSPSELHESRHEKQGQARWKHEYVLFSKEAGS